MQVTKWVRKQAFALLGALSLSAAVYGADTVQNFNAIFPPGGGGLAPSILPYAGGTSTIDVVGGWDGNAIRLTQDIGGQDTGFSLNQLVGGSFSALQFDWEMTISPGTGGGADGVGFGYANVADYGADNAAGFPNWGTSEEPMLTNSLGLGFDTFNNADLGDNGENSVSLHYNMTRLDSIALADGFLESGHKLGATVVLTPVAGGSNVSVTLKDLEDNVTETPYVNQFVPGLNPYAGRAAFKGRTGGASSEQIVDNFKITSTPVGGGAPTVVTENFNALPEGDLVAPPIPDNPPLVGGTPFTDFQGGPDPHVLIVNSTSNAGAQPGFLQMTNTNGSLSNSIAFDKTSDVADNIDAKFKLRINNSGNNADGMSFLILGADTFGDTGELSPAPSEDPNLAGALGVGFDTFDNDEEGIVDPDTGCGDGGACTDRRANHISLHWNGTPIDLNADGVTDTKDYVFIDRNDFDLVNNSWNDVEVLAKTVQGGMNVSLIVTDGKDGSVHPLIVDQFVDGMAFPQGARAAFGARTGGAASAQFIDDVNIRWTGAAPNPCDFNNDGVINVADIDLMRNAVKAGGPVATFDVDKNGAVDQDDIVALVTGKDKANTYIGDSNFDGEFSSGDFVTVFGIGEYEDAVANNSTWAEGDWNGSGDFDTSDLVFAFQVGGYELGPRAAVSAVPEPSSLILLALGGLFVVRRRK